MSATTTKTLLVLMVGMLSGCAFVRDSEPSATIQYPCLTPTISGVDRMGDMIVAFNHRDTCTTS